MDAILELRNIQTFIGQYHILQGVDLSIPKGRITALLGRNGAGKTTTLKTILGLTPPRTGEVIFEGKTIHDMHSYDIAALGIGFVPEQRCIFRDLSVEENLLIAERKRGDLKRKQDMIYDLFPDLKRLMHLRGNHLSGGQQQMLAIARALVADNRLLLIDEPSEGLAPVIIDQLIVAIRKLAAESTILLVEQNFIVASQLAEDYVIIEEGQSLKNGKIADLVNDKPTLQRFLGVA